MKVHDFNQKLEFSLSAQQKIDLDLLKRIIFGCVSVEKTDVELDKTGIDYVATLRRGAKINIDAKTREAGASRYWQHGEPEIALEIWSKVPDERSDGVVGWTLKENSDVDYVLYTFQPEDSNRFYFLPFQLLRQAFARNFKTWCDTYHRKYQPNKTYKSQAVFVPASVVIAAINKEMTGTAFYQMSI